MDLSKILAISGKPGLYEVITQTKNGFIVQSYLDNKRFPVFAHERVSSLEEISIFTDEDDDLAVKDVFKRIHDHMKGGKAPDPKSGPEDLKSFFAEVIPTYDRERVYVSDMKKVLSWYNLLLEKDLLTFEEDAPDEGPEEAMDEDTEEAPDKGTKDAPDEHAKE